MILLNFYFAKKAKSVFGPKILASVSSVPVKPGVYAPVRSRSSVTGVWAGAGARLIEKINQPSRVKRQL